MSGYPPLNTLKPVAGNIWIVDGPMIRFYGLPFSTRATVVRLASGDLWVHSPTKLTDGLVAELQALGPVAHLIAPNEIHYAYVAEWQAAFPEAHSWATPGVQERAASRGMELTFDHIFGEGAAPTWAEEIDWLVVEGSRVHVEAVFFHHASRTLILTDLIENFEAGKLPFWMRPFARLGGIVAPKGGMPRDMRATFRKNHDLLRSAIDRMIAWAPERVILAHGKWFESGGTEALRKAFAFLY